MCIRDRYQRRVRGHEIAMQAGWSCSVTRAALALVVAIVVQSTGETVYSSLNEDSLVHGLNPLEEQANEASHKWREANNALIAATKRHAPRKKLSTLAANVRGLQKYAKETENDAFGAGGEQRRLGSAAEERGSDSDKQTKDPIAQAEKKAKTVKREAGKELTKATKLEGKSRQLGLKVKKLERAAVADANELSSAENKAEASELKVAIADKQSRIKDIQAAVKDERKEAIKVREMAREKEAGAGVIVASSAAAQAEANAQAKHAKVDALADQVSKLDQEAQKTDPGEKGENKLTRKPDYYTH
eukprot:TRINITY_DN3319_c0_g1_i1.p1 TRINITY_DN3319_c0_g1~~TRINITY_DN3319_c0_g1_i1.p1  ORF type:complete len:303 (-),score=103.50 TRINITY_DN3319_c0_g1_i1:56-964(-)